MAIEQVGLLLQQQRAEKCQVPTKEQNLTQSLQYISTPQGYRLDQVGLKAAGMGRRDQAHLGTEEMM